MIKYLIDERNEDIKIPDDYQSRNDLFRALMNTRPANPIGDDFLKIQDEFLSSKINSKNLTGVSDICRSNGKLMLWQGDITTLAVDGIVNAANSKLLGCFIPLHNCIDNVIHSSAGIQLRLECDEIMKMQNHDEKIGDAKITDAYNLPSKYVIHTVGPAIAHGLLPSKKDKEKLANCYKSCLKLASEYHLESLAFCCISTGVFNFPQKQAAEIAVKTVSSYLDENKTSLEYVIFDVFSDEDYLIYKNLLFGG